MRCLHGPENQEAGSFSSYSMTKPGRERGRKRQRNAFGGKQGFQRKKGMLAEVSGMRAPESRAPASQGRVPATNCRRLRAGRCDRVYVPTNASRDPQQRCWCPAGHEGQSQSEGNAVQVVHPVTQERVSCMQVCRVHRLNKISRSVVSDSL